MNTAQLVVLWYAGLTITVVLLVRADDASSAGYLIGAIALVTALLLYSLKPHPQARKLRVLAAVLLPIGGTAVSLVGYTWYRDQAVKRALRSIPHEQLEILEPVLNKSYGTTHFVARVRNRSPHVLTGFTLQIAITEKSETIERLKEEVYLEVPPGEVRHLDEGLWGLKTDLFAEGTDGRYEWSYRLTDTKGKVAQSQ